MQVLILSTALILTLNSAIDWFNVRKSASPVLLGFAIPQTNLNSTISNLPDGNYRFCSEPPSLDHNFEETGWCFLFRKTGNRVIGNYFIAQKEQSICVTGIANNNTITGTGLELWYGWYTPISLEAVPETEWWDSPEIGGGRLKATRLSIIRRSNNNGSYSAWIRYGSVQLNLNGFHRYPAGNKLPPLKCEAK